MFQTRFSSRYTEALLLGVVFAVYFLGVVLAHAGLQVQQNENPLPGLLSAILPVIVFILSFSAIHLVLKFQRLEMEQILLPLMALLCAVGLVMIYRLQGTGGVWQQVGRGLLPGLGVVTALLIRPAWVEKMRRLAIPLSAIGLVLSFGTAFFGVVDETGARLALKLGPLPAIQTSEILKIALIIFLAWYIEREGDAAEGRAQALGWLRIPSVRYFIPGGLFVGMGVMALVQMSDFGAVMILGTIFIGMLYAGFETRIFSTVALIGFGLAALAAIILLFAWEVPTVIRFRFLAFLDPWSNTMLTIDGEPIGITVAQGPGYQIQQAIYALIAGGLSGTGLGFGSPEYIPLAHSDFIFAAILEEMGAVVGIAVLIVFVIILLRLLRLAAILPKEQAFERLLLTGVGIHLFAQLFIMVGGTINLIPVTGVTIPFLSLGGMAMLINVIEVGLALVLIRRLEVHSP